jgi:hypothetical protein
MRRVALAFTILFGLLPAAAAQIHKSISVSGQPSLDLLVTRVDNYWKLLLQRKITQAAQYIAVSDRKNFNLEYAVAFSDPCIKSLELSKDRTEAKIALTIKRIMPPMMNVEWPVKQKWRFEKGNWYLQFKPEAAPNLFSGNAKDSSEPLDREQMESAKSELREMLHFEKSVLDFGTVRQGAGVPLNLKYAFTSDKALPVMVKKSDPDIAIQGLKEECLVPGQERELLVKFPAWKYDGAVNAHIILTVYWKGIGVPFEISVKGNVYVPVSIIPPNLCFSKGEREKEILIRNNSKSDIVLRQAFSETGQVTVEPLPTTIPAGQQLKMKVKVGQALDTAKANTQDNISIPLEQPVDDMTSITFAVVANCIERKQNTQFDPSQSEDVQDLIRRSKVNMPNP